MKKIYFLLMTPLMAITVWSKTTTWTGGQNTQWDKAGNWDNGVPAANDIVIFPTNFTVAITRVAQAGDLTLTGFEVQGNSSVRLVNTALRTITIANGPSFHDLAVEGGAQLTLGTFINLTLASGTPGSPTGAGSDGDLIIEAGRTYDTDNADVETDVDGQVQNSGTLAGLAGRLFFNASSVYIHAENSGTIPLATWNSTSTASITGIINVGPTNLNQTFGNFTWNSPSQAINFSIGGVLATINGDFT